MNLLKETLMLKLSYLIMQQKHLKDPTDVDTPKFAKEIDLANLQDEIDNIDVGKLKNVPSNSSNQKCKIDELDVDNLAPVPVDLSKLSDIVKYDVVKKVVYNSNIKNIEDKIPNVSDLVKKTDYDTQISEIEKKLTNHDHDKYITTQKCNKLTSDILNAKITEKGS